MQIRSNRPSARHAKMIDNSRYSRKFRETYRLNTSAVSALLTAAALMLSTHVYFGVAEARDRNGRDRASEESRRSLERAQERERERAQEQDQALERQREAERRASESLRDQTTKEASKEAASASARNNRQAGSSTDDDDKRRSDGSSAPSKAKSRMETKKSQDDELPRTVEEMFRRWGKSLASTAEKSGGADDRRKDEDRTDFDRKAVQDDRKDAKVGTLKNAAVPVNSPAKKAARPNSGAIGLPADVVTDFKRVEVLALSSNVQAVSRAKSLGFASGSASRFERLDLSVTKLIAPDGMTASQAQALLSSAAIGNFMFNRRYRIYRAATGGRAGASHEPERIRPPVVMSTPCGTDRCYGAAMLGWRPEFSSCAAKARIGVIDTAIDARHHAFKRQRMKVKSFGRATAGESMEWHGTGVLALLAGDPDSDSPGLVPDAQFLVANAFYTDDDGLPSTDTLSLLAALDWLDGQQADIVNMSLAGPPDDLLRDALERLANKGMIFVAAAGNEGPTAPPTYPAAYPTVIAVTAVGRDLRSYRYANRGEHIDIAAPGVQIWTALPGARTTYHSGTSFAAPFATATIAALLPPAGQRSKRAVLQRLDFKDLGEPGRDPVYGNGLLVGPIKCSSQTIAASGGALFGASKGAAPSPTPTWGLTTTTIARPPSPKRSPWR